MTNNCNEPFNFDTKKITSQINYLSLSLSRIELDTKIESYEEVGMIDPLEPDMKKATEYLQNTGRLPVQKF